MLPTKCAALKGFVVTKCSRASPKGARPPRDGSAASNGTLSSMSPGRCAFQISPGNVDDCRHVPSMSTGLFGKLFGDKVCISSRPAGQLLESGPGLATSMRDNMSNRLMSMEDKLMLRRRSLIETVNDRSKNISQIERSGHRSPKNFATNLLAGLAAYCFQPKKPSITPLPSRQISFS